MSSPADALAAIRALEEARDAALALLVDASPYGKFLGVGLARMGDELTVSLPFDPHLIGNPSLPAIHGGVTGSFLEIAALMQLSWSAIWERIEAGGDARTAIANGALPPWPKTIDISIDYLRSGRAKDMFARAIVARKGRRVANVRIEAWQDDRGRPFAAAHGHFLMPDLS